MIRRPVISVRVLLLFFVNDFVRGVLVMLALVCLECYGVVVVELEQVFPHFTIKEISLFKISYYDI